MRRFPALAVLTAGFALALSGVALADVDVTISDDGLQPENVRADVREDIIWTNTTDEAVSLVGEEPAWESGPIDPGATFSIQITETGTYAYSSEDGSLGGEIVVGQADGDQAEDDPFDEPDADGDDGDAGAQEDDDDAVQMPDTGLGAAAPGVLSLLLIATGGGLLVAARPQRPSRG